MGIKYKSLAGQLREQVNNYTKRGINKFPSESELSKKYNVSRQTVRQALSILENEGMIEKRQGSGTYITGLHSDPQKNRIAILVSDDSDYIYPRLLADIYSVLTMNGFSGNTYLTKNRTFSERLILSELLKNPPRGIIAEGCKSALPNPNLDLYHRLQKKGTALVFLHNHYHDFETGLYVKDDNQGGGTLLTNHLLKQGHRNIGGIFHIEDQQGIERFQGFTEAMLQQNLSIPDERICWFHTDALYRLQYLNDSSFLKKAVQESLCSCTAVVCYNDIIAYHLIKELKLAGYHLPDDMAITAFDNTYLSKSEILPFTTLSHQPHEMGTRAAQMMIDHLKGLPTAPQIVPWKLIPRGSTMENL